MRYGASVAWAADCSPFELPGPGCWRRSRRYARDVSDTDVIRPAEQAVRLRSAGFESCVARCPTRTRGGALEWFFVHPAHANVSAFVSELLAACLVPARRPREVAALPESDRARLRLAVVAVCGREREWRKLHGSHLTADERLMAVIVWRWREHERRFARMRERRRELAARARSRRGRGPVRSRSRPARFA